MTFGHRTSSPNDHRYQINNISMWCDYLRMLVNLGEDIRNPKNICPEDFIEAHDKVNRRIEAKHRKERAEAQRRMEIERREREQRKLLQEQQREEVENPGSDDPLDQG